MRIFVLLAAVAVSGCASDCNVTEATGLFEIFKTEGCITSISSKGSALDAMSFSHSGSSVLVDGIDSVAVFFDDRLYAGRRGACQMSNEDVMVDQGERGHCDYVIRGYEKTSDTESRYTVEFLDAYLQAYGKKGTMKGVMTVQVFNLGGTP